MVKGKSAQFRSVLSIGFSSRIFCTERILYRFPTDLADNLIFGYGTQYIDNIPVQSNDTVCCMFLYIMNQNQVAFTL